MIIPRDSRTNIAVFCVGGDLRATFTKFKARLAKIINEDRELLERLAK